MTRSTAHRASRAGSALLTLTFVLGACGNGSTVAVDSESSVASTSVASSSTPPAEEAVPTTSIATSPTASTPAPLPNETVVPPAASEALTDVLVEEVAVETRPEILRLALATADGGTFDPNSVAGKPVLLWFWAAH